MPTLYEYFGLFFFFFSRDHEPIHIHVSYAEFQNKLVYIYKNGKLIDVEIKRIKGKKPLPNNKMVDAKKFVIKYEKDISNKWTEFYGKNKKPTLIKITKKI